MKRHINKITNHVVQNGRKEYFNTTRKASHFFSILQSYFTTINDEKTKFIRTDASHNYQKAKKFKGNEVHLKKTYTFNIFKSQFLL